MKDHTDNPLTVSEISGLWNAYMDETMAVCTLKHYLNHVEDNEIKSLIQRFLHLSQEHIKKLEHFYNKENLSIPQGFTDSDVNLDAPRLFTDVYYPLYLNTMVGFGMDSYSLIVRYAPRLDIRQYFSQCLIESLELTNETINLLLSKGLFIKPPRFEVSKEVTYIKKESFLSGLLTTPRPMLAREATNTFTGIIIDTVVKALLVGFGQSARSKEVKDFMFKGRDLIAEHYNKFILTLSKEQIPVSSTFDTFVTDSTTAPFSEKLMMNHVLTMCTFILSVDGAAIASSMRTDLATIHTAFGAEIAKYASDCITIMINNRWMEQPPQAIKHEKLTNK